MVDAPSAKKAPQTPATPQTTGSKTLFVGNLSFSVEENDVINFFKDAGEVVEVRFAVRDDRFAGYGHVEFATPEAARKALELNGQLLLDREVRLDLAKERGAYTPGTGNERSFQKSGQTPGLTAFVRGFGYDESFDDIRSTLGELFDFETRGPKGVAFIDFTDCDALNKAIDLSGTDRKQNQEVMKEILNVVEVVDLKVAGAVEELGLVAGADGSGGMFSSGRRRGDGGRGGRGGDRGRGHSRPSMATPGTGKKTTFGDD
ncbi:hypothetical protein M8C21_016393 [Ambrosia artemisiifolia]|uniref:RRM domain-containing protein n=1 Tax=Ambrosia artemisiifolia TaxID=4212 RepID=A0AAD5C2J4_AMBAR|nr:hypothetical protein M8C21_016393 [Ambrosia artemisiifolia]